MNKISLITALGLFLISSTALAQTYVFRAYDPGLKADNNSKVRQEHDRQQEAINAEMCLTQYSFYEEQLVEVDRVNLNQPAYTRTSLNFAEGIALADMYQVVRDGQVISEGIGNSGHFSFYYGIMTDDRDPDNIIYRATLPAILNPDSTTISFPSSNYSYFGKEPGDIIYYTRHEPHVTYQVGAPIPEIYVDLLGRSYQYYQLSIVEDMANVSNDIVAFNQEEVLIQSENYEWCVNNGYSTLNNSR